MNKAELAAKAAEKQKQKSANVAQCLAASGWQQIGTEENKQALVFTRTPRPIKVKSKSAEK